MFLFVYGRTAITTSIVSVVIDLNTFKMYSPPSIDSTTKNKLDNKYGVNSLSHETYVEVMFILTRLFDPWCGVCVFMYTYNINTIYINPIGSINRFYV